MNVYGEKSINFPLSSNSKLKLIIWLHTHQWLVNEHTQYTYKNYNISDNKNIYVEWISVAGLGFEINKCWIVYFK